MQVEEAGSIPSYSSDGLDVLGEFHETDVVIFVEGDEDILFWSSMVNLAGVRSFTFDSVGSKSQIDEKIRQVVEDNALVVVACDSDHSPFLDSHVDHIRVVRTPGYSIENTTFCPVSLVRLLRKLSRSATADLNIITGWYDRFCREVLPLLEYDLANQVFRIGVSVFGDSCARHLIDQKSEHLSPTKIRRFIEEFEDRFEEEQLERVRQMIAEDGREIRMLIKGHYLVSGVRNLLKNEAQKLRGKRPNLSDEHLLSATIDCCEYCGVDHECQSKDELLEAVRAAVASITEAA